MKRHLGWLLFLTSIALGNNLIDTSRSLIHLLNYVGSDYGGAVQNGKIVNSFEYAEQKEFTQTMIELSRREQRLISSTPLTLGLSRLKTLVDNKAPFDQIQKLASELKQEVFKISSLPNAPEKWPNIQHGKEVFSQNCAQCHGPTGRGDGPSSGNFDPKPTNFLDAKNDSISPFQYFNAIRLGVPGTAMSAFNSISEKETWDLAFYLSSLRHEGKASPEVISHPWTLAQVASLSDVELKALSEKDPSKTQSALSLARTFEVSEGSQSSLIALTEDTLKAAFDAFKDNKFELAKTKAISAYLDGIEPLEPKLRLNNPEFTVKLEQALSTFRRKIDERVTVGDLEKEFKNTQQLLVDAREVLATKPSSFWVTYTMAGGIFIREALESALLIITLLGIVRNLGNVRAIYFIHAGWLSAFGVGLLCWVFSGWVVGVSGLRREVLEGSISLLGVVVLLYFGYWLHRKTEIGKWRNFINEMVKSALDNKKLLGLAVVSFMGVFREAFETVLFLRALLIESPGQDMALGLGVATALLAVVVASSVIMKYSARLPLKQLFTVSSLMMLFLAFILTGKSVHAFQEAGFISQTIIAGNFRIEWLGIYPSLESLVPQSILLAVAFALWLQTKFQSVGKKKVTA